MSDESAGKPPVVILREESSVTSGTAVQEKLIAATRVFADLLRPTFGPRGLDKMLYKTDGTTAVTNDGAKIIAELMVKHPAAKMLVAMAETQENECGDGVTGTLLFCSELLIEANRLMDKGLHPLVISSGYEKAKTIALDAIQNISTQIKIDDHDTLCEISSTALTGKGSETSTNTLSKLVVSTLQAVTRTEEDGTIRCEAEDVTMHKIGSGTIDDSHLVRGIIFRRRILLDSLPSLIENAKVATIHGNIAPRKQIRNAEIEIEEIEQLDAFIESEESTRDQLTKILLASGANVFLCTGEVDKGILHRLMRKDCFVAGELDERELKNTSAVTGSRIVELLTDISSEDIGHAGRMTAERHTPSEKVEDIITLEECNTPNVVTCAIGGANDLAVEEAIRAIHDSLRSTSIAIRDGRVLHGGGATHMACALAIREAAEKEPGRERLAMEAYARALEIIPASLAQNAGADALDQILELRAAHRSKSSAVGITESGKVGLTGARIAAKSLESSIYAATETCASMLRIDQVISARGD
ncbi:MAG: TCP-1/cpn60 chaperonin family protein [Candidatus Thermoplasmatota archaeon]|nr:TCP-1/cpn60 chaperonin family protein [Candidatus Thermoplasmatota archaeon]